MNLIVAVEKNWGIGMMGDIPWHISADMKYFKQKTIGKTVVMGRKTLLSFPNSKPLKDRENIVLSKNAGFVCDGAVVLGDSEKIKQLSERDDVFIIGGASIYREFLPYCRYAYVTKIDKEYECDTFFENLDINDNWEMISESEKMSENGVDFCFLVYENKAFSKKHTESENEEAVCICEAEDDFDADIKISLLDSCSIKAFKRYSGSSAVAKIYCGNSNLGVGIYVGKDHAEIAKSILEAPFDMSQIEEQSEDI